MRLRGTWTRAPPAAASGDFSGATAAADKRSVAVLYFENLSGVKEDEYFRDGVTEDIITELSKIKGLNIFSRPTVLAFRDKPVTPAQIGQQLSAAYVLTGSLRRAGNRLRINAQLVDTRPTSRCGRSATTARWKDVFEVQDEIARKIAEALRVTLTPQEQEAIAAKPTENLQAYDLYLRGKSYARRLTRQDMEFALQMFQNAVALDPDFALAHAAIAKSVLSTTATSSGRHPGSSAPRPPPAGLTLCNPSCPTSQVAQAWIRYTEGDLRRCDQRRPAGHRPQGRL